KRETTIFVTASSSYVDSCRVCFILGKCDIFDQNDSRNPLNQHSTPCFPPRSPHVLPRCPPFTTAEPPLALFRRPSSLDGCTTPLCYAHGPNLSTCRRRCHSYCWHPYLRPRGHRESLCAAQPLDPP
ncbi:unnamed protein product, partial [Ectocarpus sp. 4 AP-2014]